MAYFAMKLLIEAQNQAFTAEATVKSLKFQSSFHWLRSFSVQRAYTIDWIALIIEVKAAIE